VRRHINKRSCTVESDDDDRVIDSSRKRRRTNVEDLNQVRKELAEAREKHAALQQQIERDAQTAEEYAEAHSQLQTYIQANETLRKDLSNMAGRERELREVQEQLQDVERREAELLGDAARREAELRATIDELKAQMADLERQRAEGQPRGDNGEGQNSEESPNGVFDLTADGTNPLLESNDVPQTPDVNPEPGDSDLARDTPQTSVSNASPDDNDPSRDAADHRCISPLQCVPGWSKDPRSTDLTAHVDVNGTWDEV
jgi:DNA repair exonuclease SbcCD ATPase subunit